MSKQGLSNKQRRYKAIDISHQVRYNRTNKQTRRRTVIKNTKHKDNIMNELDLSYDKYGCWVDGEWMPYDDMGV